MKLFLFVSAMVLALSVQAQDAVGLLKASEAKTYTPKARALTDMVVDLINPQVTKQLNDQMIFGTLKEVSFRIYWTANPERVAIEVFGLPEGFREIKEELKAVMIGNLETILPLTLEKKFQGYQFRAAVKQPKTVIATDPTNLRPVPEYVLIFDQEGRLQESVAKKPVGIVSTRFQWAKAPWSEPRHYVTQTVTRSEEGPQQTEITSAITWQAVAGIGLPAVMKTKTHQVLRQPGQPSKPIERTVEETLYFKNYKVNAGEAMKWFLGHSTATP